MEISSFLDYRQFLKSWYAAKRAEGKYFSFRFFSKMAGFGSPSYLKMVMDGQRNLKSDSITKFVRALKLSKKEGHYFEALVCFNQASSEKERDNYFERLMALRPAVKLKGLEKNQYEYFSQKYFVIIREMVGLANFEENAEWIASNIIPPIKPSEALHAIRVLLRLGLLRRNKKGKLEQTEESLTTPLEVSSLEVYNFHREMLGEAVDAMLKIPYQFREMSAVTISIPFELLPKIKKRIHDFQEKIIDSVNRESKNYDEVYQFNFQLFPVTNAKGIKK